MSTTSEPQTAAIDNVDAKAATSAPDFRKPRKRSASQASPAPSNRKRTAASRARTQDSPSGAVSDAETSHETPMPESANQPDASPRNRGNRGAKPRSGQRKRPDSQNEAARKKSMSQATQENEAHQPPRRARSSHTDEIKEPSSVSSPLLPDGNNGLNEQTQPADAPQDTASKKTRRGKRGGRPRKTASPDIQTDSLQTASGDTQQDIFVSVTRITQMLAQAPALPPGSPLPLSLPQPQPSEPPKAAAAQKTAKTARPRAAQETARPASKRMLICVLPGEQVEVGISESGRLLEYYLDMLHQSKLKGNIYKGIVHNIDTNLQAAFVDYGSGKNGFLQIEQIHPEYWQTSHEATRERKFPPIHKALKIGQEILVQVVKEPAGSKGAFLTTWLSLAGRFLVLTPGQEQIGVSRKVVDPDERQRLKQMMTGIDPGNGLGVIVRTVGEGATKTTLKNDLQYLKRLWRDIRKKATEVAAPAQLYQEPGLSERSVRDYLTDDISEIWVDNETVAQNVMAMVSLLFPRKKNLVHLHEDPGQSLWEKFHLRSQLDQIYSREVILPSGGRLVFDQTEALMAIDINSGKISGKGNFEAMAFKTNMEAALAIASQLRLRDIGGQVVIDFIEMRDKKHVLEVEKSLRQAMKNDRARHDVSRISSFGLLELVRQRMGSSALSICMETCAACGGTGLRHNLEWQALRSLQDLRYRLKTAPGGPYVYEASRELGLYLLNHKRNALRMLEEDFGKTVEIKITF